MELARQAHVVGVAADALEEAGILHAADRLSDREFLDDDRISHRAAARGRVRA
jgi:hypothetical protein